MLEAFTADPWPYPRWIAHRGAGQFAPENTLAALSLGAACGYRMFECDVKLSADGVLFLLHDDTLERTTDGVGDAGRQSWQNLSRLDAGGWHSPAFAGEPLALLETIAAYCLTHGYFLNIEIKPSPGLEAATGAAVADAAARLWKKAPAPPLLTSFHPAALQAARAAQPRLPRGLLLDRMKTGMQADWRDTARELGCAAVVGHHTLWNQVTVSQARGVGLRTLAYTVNDPETAQRLLALGTDGIITDRVDVFRPDA